MLERFVLLGLLVRSPVNVVFIDKLPYEYSIAVSSASNNSSERYKNTIAD